MEPASAVTLSALPPELVLRILAFLDPQSIVRLSSTCTTLNSIGRDEGLWRRVVLGLVNDHGDTGGLDERDEAPSPTPRHERTWLEAARFLLPLSNRLGWFASSKRFTSRLIRVSIRSSSPAQANATSPVYPPYYTLHAAHFRARNLFDVPNHPIPPSLLPFGSVLDPHSSSSYMLSPNLNPLHPYSGLSVDVLDPRYDFSGSMFECTPEDGAYLSRAGERAASAQTRETILAAAMAQGIIGGGGGLAALANLPRPPSPSSSPSPVRLRLSLEDVELPVERSKAHSHPFRRGLDLEDDDEEDDLDGVGRTTRETLFPLFSGRLPPVPWPTLGLVGLEEVSRTELYGEAAGGSVIRAAGGAFRGLHEALTGQGGELPLARVEEAGIRSNREEAFVTGFRLRAKRTPQTSFSRTSPSVATETASSSSVDAGAAARRRGVGPNGGLAVLWNGAEQDPDERPAVTILRAGDEADGGVVLHLPHTPDAPEPTPLPASNASPPVSPTTSPSPDSALADAIDSSSEAFFPIKPPARPLSFTSPFSINEHGEILASSLKGLWVGSYGGHGLEFVYLTTGFAEVPSDSSGTARLHRLVTATKVTGDTNVPSGQTSWVALLPSPELANFPSPSSPASPSSLSATSTMTDPSPLLDGPLPSTSLSLFTHLSSLDPFSPAYSALNNGSGPDWSEGTVSHAWGRIATPGFAEASWTGAEVRFLRSEVKVRREREQGEGEEEERLFESVEEIHLRWGELHKVSCFKRVRVA
ncbi:hypothetical protein JCM8547_007922 [Rhodosporidiobolus lusitaniae]